MMEQFTKGPWFISEHGAIKSEHAKTATGAISAPGISCPMYKCEEAEANAALISAAPEMYAEVKEYISLLNALINDGYIGYVERRSAAVELLVKARGEQ